MVYHVSSLEGSPCIICHPEIYCSSPTAAPIKMFSGCSVSVLALFKMDKAMQGFGFSGWRGYEAAGAFWSECGGDLATSKRILQECCTEFDEGVRLQRSFHRKAYKIFGHNTLCRLLTKYLKSLEVPLKSL